MRKLVFTTLIVAALVAPVLAQAQTPPPSVAPPQQPTVQQQTPPPPPPPTVAPGRGGRGGVAPGQTPPPARGGGIPSTQGGRGQGGQPGPQPGMNVAITRGPWQVPLQNIRVELTIGDSGANRAKKAVSLLLADGYGGRIRSGTATGTLNVDGTARAGADGRILLDLTIEYMPDRSATTALLNQSISVVVANGQATLVSRSADPATDRSVTVEVVATIVK